MDDFKHSKPYSHKLPPWAAHATSLPVRISKHEEYAAEISKNFANKLERKSVPIKSPAGQEYLGHAEFGHFVCLMVPECLPDHIPALVRALDFFCITDFAALKDGQIGDRKQGSSTLCSLKKKLKLLMAEQGLAIVIGHPISGFRYMKRMIIYMKVWKDFSPEMPKEGASFVGQFPSRFFDVGSTAVMATLEFGMGIKLTRNSAKKLQALAILTCATMALSNDIFSWPKEQIEQQNTQVVPFSCIVMLMQEFSCGEEEALVRCRYKLLQYEKACGELSRELRDNPRESLDVKRMALAYPLAASGCTVWQATCARYQCENSSMDLVRKVMGAALPTVELDDAFKEESEKVLLSCTAIMRKYAKFLNF